MLSYILPTLAFFAPAVLAEFDHAHHHHPPHHPHHHQHHAHARAHIAQPTVTAGILGPEFVPSRFEKARRERPNRRQVASSMVTASVAGTTGTTTIVSRQGVIAGLDPAIILLVAAGLLVLCVVLLTILFCQRRRPNGSTRPKDTPATIDKATQDTPTFRDQGTQCLEIKAPLAKKKKEAEILTLGEWMAREKTSPSPPGAPVAIFNAPFSPGLPSSTHPSHSDLANSPLEEKASPILPVVGPKGPFPSRPAPAPPLTPPLTPERDTFRRPRPGQLAGRPRPLSLELFGPGHTRSPSGPTSPLASPPISSPMFAPLHFTDTSLMSPEALGSPIAPRSPATGSHTSDSEYDDAQEEDRRASFNDGFIYQGSQRTLPPLVISPEVQEAARRSSIGKAQDDSLVNTNQSTRRPSIVPGGRRRPSSMVEIASFNQGATTPTPRRPSPSNQSTPAPWPVPADFVPSQKNLRRPSQTSTEQASSSPVRAPVAIPPPQRSSSVSPANNATTQPRIPPPISPTRAIPSGLVMPPSISPTHIPTSGPPVPELDRLSPRSTVKSPPLSSPSHDFNAGEITPRAEVDSRRPSFPQYPYAPAPVVPEKPSPISPARSTAVSPERPSVAITRTSSFGSAQTPSSRPASFYDARSRVMSPELSLPPTSGVEHLKNPKRASWSPSSSFNRQVSFSDEVPKKQIRRSSSIDLTPSSAPRDNPSTPARARSPGLDSSDGEDEGPEEVSFISALLYEGKSRPLGLNPLGSIAHVDLPSEARAPEAGPSSPPTTFDRRRLSLRPLGANLLGQIAKLERSLSLAPQTSPTPPPVNPPPAAPIGGLAALSSAPGEHVAGPAHPASQRGRTARKPAPST